MALVEPEQCAVAERRQRLVVALVLVGMLAIRWHTLVGSLVDQLACLLVAVRASYFLYLKFISCNY